MALESDDSIVNLFSRFASATERPEEKDHNLDSSFDTAGEEVSRPNDGEAALELTQDAIVTVCNPSANSATNDSQCNGVVIENPVFDIELPSISQIHMSQVEELPSPLRRQIVSKIEEADNKAQRRRDKTSIPSVQPNDCGYARFFQVDMRRMMKLAAVKAGQPSSSRDPISVSQLESLPFEMQLQIANDDDRPVGVRSRNSRRSARLNRKVAELSQKCVAVDRKAEQSTRKDSVLAHDLQGGEGCSPTCSFYLENVKPMSIFLDENDAQKDEAVGYVVRFLELCAEENRFSDAAVLLRSIRNRDDDWSANAFEKVFESVNYKAKERLGCGLDRDWIMSGKSL